MSFNSKSVELPESLQPYDFHKVTMTSRSGSKEVTADCPFCGRSGKLSINSTNGMWRCLLCNEGEEKGKSVKGGNSMVFLRTLFRLGREAVETPSTKTQARYKELTVERGFLQVNTLHRWEIAPSLITDEWTIPSYNPEGKLCQLSRYARIKGSDGTYKNRWLNTKTLAPQIFGMHLWNKSKPFVYVCEGPWDAMILYEMLTSVKRTENGLAPTGSVRSSLYNEANIIALPGCNQFNERWSTLFEDLHVILMFDNDHPKKHPKTGQLIPPAALAGAKRVTEILTSSHKPPSSINYLCWGTEGFDPNLPSGTDLRDMFKASGNLLGPRVKALDKILSKVTYVPDEWVKSSPTHSGTSKSKSNQIECTSYKELVNSWKKALKWTDGLDHALGCMLATASSTMRVGDQLWMKIIGPASCGKTTLGQALASNEEHIVVRDVIRGFTSGWRQEDGSTFDLASEVNGKTMLTLDGDTLIQSPGLTSILSEGRRLYDGSLVSHFKNGSGKDIMDHRFTWLLFGTSSLRSIDQSELGERFLDCVVMEGIDNELEDEILMRVANRVVRNMSIDIHQIGAKQDEPDMAAAKAMTAGYVSYLKKNLTQLMSKIETSDASLFALTRLGKFVAFMRARPSAMQDEVAEREFAARLVSQHIRLATCLAAVLNKPSLEGEPLKRTRKVALDTARGKTMEIARHLFNAGEEGIEPKTIALYTTQKEADVRKLLKFLKQIQAAEIYIKPSAKGIQGKAVWRLTEQLKRLWAQVHEL